MDCAFKTGQSNDYSVIAVVSEAKTGFHIRLVSRGRWEFPELKRQAVALAEIWRPHAVLIEDAASGQSLVQALKAETRLPILPVKPQGDKVPRAHAVSPLVESGRVSVPPAAPWLADFLDELTSFPAAAHDDMVDAFAQALNWMRGSFRDSEDFQRTQAQFSEMRRRERSVAAYPGRMINNVADADALEYGTASPTGQQYTNRTTFGRIRGGF